MSLSDLRQHLLTSSQTFVALIQRNKEFKEKLKKVALQLTDLEKDRAELERVTDDGSKKKNEVDRMTA